ATNGGMNQPRCPVGPMRPPSSTVCLVVMYVSMSLACPDGHTSRFASIVPESSAAHTAFSSMSLRLTFIPCFSRIALATAALAAEPSHGFTASVIVPLNVFAPPAAVVPVVDVLLLLLPHAASASERTTVPMTSRLRFMLSPSDREVWFCWHGWPAVALCVPRRCEPLRPTLESSDRARRRVRQSPRRLPHRARARSWSDRRRRRPPMRHLRRAPR